MRVTDKWIDRQTQIRRQLLANGYTPLANLDKMCILKGWPTLVVTDAMIDEWNRSMKYVATGVRIERGLVMLDFDIDDEAGLQAIWDALPGDLRGILRRAPLRYGKGVKEAYFVRLADGEEGFGRLASSGWIKPSEAHLGGDATVHRLEVFAGGASRQAGAYGVHSLDADDHIKVEYQWSEDIGLCEVPFSDLPRITRKQVGELGAVVNTALDRLGWTQYLRGGKGLEPHVGEVFDLHDEMIFQTQRGPMTMAEAEAWLAVNHTLRCSASWLEGDVAKNQTRCIMGLSPRDGRLMIYETSECVTHRPEALDKARVAHTLGTLLVGLGMPTGGGSDDERGDFDEPGEEGFVEDRIAVEYDKDHSDLAVRATLEVYQGLRRLFDAGGGLAVIHEGDRMQVLTDPTVAGNYITRDVVFGRFNAEGEWLSMAPPPAVAKTILSMGEARGLPKLAGVTPGAAMRPDGTVASEVGYDEASGLWIGRGARRQLAGPLDRVSDAEAIGAVERLWAPFVGFPFESEKDRGAMLAALLTAATRGVFPAAPIFAFDAPVQGSGKTTLCRCLSLLAGDGEAGVSPPLSRDEEEVRKVLMAEALRGSKAVIFDNQIGMVDSAALGAFVTAPVFNGRVLGGSLVLNAPTRMMVMLSGNNLMLGGDMARRVLNVRLDPKVETPWLREFAFDPFERVSGDLDGMRLAALTVLRWWTQGEGWAGAKGRLGSFTLWDRMVGQCVASLVGRGLITGYADPLDASLAVAAVDPVAEERGALLGALWAAFGASRFKAGDVVVKMLASTRNDLRELLGDGHDVPSIRAVGKRLAARRDAVSRGMALRMKADASHGSTFWLQVMDGSNIVPIGEKVTDAS